MALQISQDHLIFGIKPTIHEISKNFLQSFGFNYFQYLRCFADGSVSLLTNFTGLMEHFQHADNSPVVFSSFETENEKAHSYWFLWDEKLPKMPVQLAREKYQLHNGLTLVRRSKAYYDMIAVALPSEQANPGSFYLNKLKSIEQFIDAFDRDNKDLIALMNKNPIALPEPYRDSNYQHICLTKGRLSFLGKEGETYVTTQELSCLRLIFQGASSKEAAQILGLSPRTVETYLKRIKLRSGYSSYIELKEKLASCSAL